MMSKILVFSLLVMFTANSFAAIKIWDGGGTNAYLATKENWSGDVAPVSGDYLVFAGSTRTSVTNDYAPETTTFKMLVFSNNYTTSSSPFTLSGNEIVLTGCVGTEYPAFATGTPAIGVANASSSITDILALNIRLPNTSKLGGYTANNHHLTFSGTVKGNGGLLQSCDQYHSTLTFEGAVTNFSGVARPNGNGSIWLRSAANAFTSSTFTHAISQGSLKVDSLGAYGGLAAGILLGQNLYNTPGRFSMNADQDTRINGNLTVRGPQYYTTAGTFENLVANTRLTLGGNLNTVTGYENANPLSNLGTMVTFGGVGNGVFLGNMTTASTWLNKSGTGTWEFAGGSTSSSTGDVTISQGTLILNGNYASMKKTTVKSGATLAGTGTVNNVTFESGANYRVLTDTADIHALILTGNVTVSGGVGVSISAEALANLTAGVEYTLIRYTSKSGAGKFTLGDGFTSSALLTEKSDRLVLQLATGEVIWKGDATNNVWDTTTLNWVGSALYSDGKNASFTDSADEGTTNVTISSEVHPLKVAVTGSRNYTFSGEGIKGPAVIEKRSGTSTLTLNNTNAYTGITSIESGALVLNGTIADSRVWIDPVAAFTNTASGRLTGSASLVINGKANLSGNSDFTGGTTIAVALQYVPEQVPVLVSDLRALGSGDVSVLKGTVTFQTAGGSFGRNKTLALGESGNVLIFVNNAIAVTWLGDVNMPNKSVELRPRSSSSSLTFGEPGCSTEVRATSAGGIVVREGGELHWYSRLKLGGGFYQQTDYNVSHFYATGNAWSYLLLQANGAMCHATNTLAPTKLSLGQIYFSNKFYPWIDLNGYDQTIAELEMVAVIEGSTQTIRSDTPAMLTISNNTNTVTARQGGRIVGEVTLRKQGTGNWSFGCSNLSAGDFIVEGGTVTLTASDTLPTASKESRLTILAGAKVAVPEGVNAAVSKFSYKDVQYASGVYGGEGCAVPGARILPVCFAPGAGAVTVTRGDGGFLILIR
jgi:autotransporter-associated beta strand protein